ncbi:MAG: ABC transporter ATP-binding protein [Spirochaetales bacterium]|uniref:ABC transporter ATP-binding protein n=1 Tax=Candidatus Thalassospirochaeta sargassi TaxID=3119039 RepID=A0AAJ1IDT2_9SPIO|nr:ABC transporter ATP-binding protein [Spirochaetales bacterium]
MEGFIKFLNVCKQYHDASVLKDLNISVPLGESLSVLGPSGSGKTTLLKILANIITADSGSVVLPHTIKSQPVLVFQDYQLFPYMTVYNNIAFGLQARRLPKKEIKEKVEAMAVKLSIDNRLKAYPAQLSGGEKQRCALARALVLKPEVILLDEPFANLDRNLKSETAEFLRSIQQDFKLTMITVTHDQEEALMLSDWLAILVNGEMLEFGRAEDIYFQPGSLEAARFLGPVNEIPRSLYAYFLLESTDSVYCRAESLEMIPDENGKAKIKSKHFKGRYFRYTIELADTSIQLFSQQKDLCGGDRVDLKLKEFFSF